MGAGREPHSGMWIVVSAISAIWTASLPAIVPSAIMDRHGIGITAANGRGTVMATATGITALAGAPHLITTDTEEIGRQPVIPPITAGKPKSMPGRAGLPVIRGARGRGDHQCAGCRRSGLDRARLTSRPISYAICSGVPILTMEAPPATTSRCSEERHDHPALDCLANGPGL